MSRIQSKPAQVTIDGQTYYATPAAITSTMLGIEDHGIMSFSIACKGDGWGVSVGGYVLDDKPAERTATSKRQPTIACGALIAEVLEVFGISSWEKLPHLRCHVLNEHPDAWGRQAVGIANADLSRAIVFGPFFAALCGES